MKRREAVRMSGKKRLSREGAALYDGLQSRMIDYSRNSHPAPAGLKSPC